ncbi:MAG: DUF4446 family protein [Actinobacteria bacterium]|nr:DUF4446 family protein [Actinomycetota bacterium]
MMTAAVAEQLAAIRTDVDAARSAADDGTNSAQAALAERLDAIESQLTRGLRNVALVRYDAFEDMAGRLSFSVALLDDGGSGVTITSLAGRADTRVYAKGIRAGVGEHELSPEEREAVAAAVGGSSSLRRLQRKAG